VSEQEFIATAKVAIVPDFSTFKTQLAKGLQGSSGAAGKAASGALTNTLQQQSNATRNLTQQIAGATNQQQRFNKQTDVTKAKLLGLGSASARLDAALLGLRTAVGSTAVIGLGAGALAAIAFGQALRSVVSQTAQFETTLNTFRVVAGATASEMERVTATAEQLGADISLPAVSAADAAEAMTELSKAGLTVQDSIDGAKGVLQLATAAAISNAQAVEIAASALNAFGLAGKEAATVADVLANAANSAQGSIADIGLGLQQAAAVGRQVGLSFQDTSTFLTILAKNGLAGSDAGTSLRTALIRLINPTDEAAKRIKELGVVLRDAQGNLRVDVFQQFTNALRGASPEVRDQTLALIGGQDALRAFSILGRQSTADLLRFREELRKEGTAAEVAAAKTEGLAGSANALSSTLQTIGIRIGTSFSAGAADFVNGITAAVNAMASSEGVAAGFGAAAATVGAAFDTIGAAAAVAGPLVLGLAGALGMVASAIGGPAIVAGAASFVLLRSALVGVTTTSLASMNIFTTLAIRFYLARDAALGLAASLRTLSLATLLPAIASGFKAVVSKMAAFAKSGNAIVLALTAVAIGVTYLISRDSDLERATKSLKSATDELAASLSNLKATQESLRGADRSVASGGLAVEQAKLAEAQARAALAGSNAARGSIERRQLEIALAVAIQNVTFSQQDYTKALDDQADAQANLRADTLAREQALAAEAAAVQSVIDAERERASFAQVGRGGIFTTDAEVEQRAIREVTETLREQARVSATSREASVRDIGERKRVLAALLETAKDVSKVDLGQIFDSSQSFKQIGKTLSRDFRNFGFNSSKEFMDWFIKGIVAEVPNASSEWAQAVADSFSQSAFVIGEDAGEKIMDGVVQGIRNAKGKIAGAAEDILDLEIAGASDRAILEAVRRQEAEQRKVVAEQEGRFKKGEVSEETVRREKATLAEIVARRRALEESIKSDAERAATDIKNARDASNQAVTKIFGDEQTRAQTRITVAEGTKGLTDDIKFTIALRNLMIRQMAEARKKITDQEELRDFLREQNARLAGVKNSIKDLYRERTEALVEAAKAAREARKTAAQSLIQSIELDIGLAETRDNVAGQIAGKERLIAALKKAQDLEKRGSVAWKEYRNQIAATNKEIDELRGTVGERNRAFASLSFEFLQTQQGFAANLLGNLIPGGASAGLVGNVSPPTAAGLSTVRATGNPGVWGTAGPINGAISTEAAVSGGAAAPTAGQMATLIQINQRMLESLEGVRRGAGHPEAKHSKATQAGGHDFTPYY
jgi:TP901 family phage tail tape measure protein